MDSYIGGVTFEPSARRPSATFVRPHTFARVAHSRYVRTVDAQIFFTSQCTHRPTRSTYEWREKGARSRRCGVTLDHHDDDDRDRFRDGDDGCDVD